MTDHDATSTTAHEVEGLRLTGMVKQYSGRTVLKEVDLRLRPSTVVGLIGENGAGKSTLSGILTGSVQPDGGTMTLDGRPYAPKRPADALDEGVALIHQEIRLLPELTIAENIFLGRQPIRRGRIDRDRMISESREHLAVLGVDIDPRRPVEGLSMAVQQEIEIAKAISRAPRYVVFDEPSASLGEAESERVLEQIGVLREHGAGVIYISHRLDEVREIADEIVCLRDGARVASWDTGDVPREQLVTAMVGREFKFEFVPATPQDREVVLSVRGLGRTGVFADVEFDVSAGEVLGIAGLVGAGRSEVVRAIAGADPHDEGEVLLDGTPLPSGDPRAAIRSGVVMVTEDRKGLGLHLGRTAAQNLTLPWERRIARRGVLTSAMVQEVGKDVARRFDIRGRMDEPVKRMSGGNQQKVLIGKWLLEQPRVLIVDEPTRGVDVGAKMAIYAIINELAESGVAVIVVSSELEEILGLSHRVLVMAGGRQAGILSRDEATPEEVLALASPTTDAAAA